jgi:hypothetical protein
MDLIYNNLTNNYYSKNMIDTTFTTINTTYSKSDCDGKFALLSSLSNYAT